jgi:hypothetical protein
MHRKKMEKVGYSGCDSVSVGANDGKREDVFGAGHREASPVPSIWWMPVISQLC